MSKLHEAKHHVSVKLDMDEMDLTAAESKENIIKGHYEKSIVDFLKKSLRID